MTACGVYRPLPRLSWAGARKCGLRGGASRHLTLSLYHTQCRPLPTRKDKVRPSLFIVLPCWAAPNRRGGSARAGSAQGRLVLYSTRGRCLSERVQFGRACMRLSTSWREVEVTAPERDPHVRHATKQQGAI
jgi:hypothetical protein